MVIGDLYVILHLTVSRLASASRKVRTSGGHRSPRQRDSVKISRQSASGQVASTLLGYDKPVAEARDTLLRLPSTPALRGEGWG